MQYDCEPGKYECECGAKFFVAVDGSATADSLVYQRKTQKVARIATPWEYDMDEPAESDIEKTIPPRQHREADSDIDVTMPGKREHKPDGRFDAGNLILGRYKVLSELGQGGMGVVYMLSSGICFAEKYRPHHALHSPFSHSFLTLRHIIRIRSGVRIPLHHDEKSGSFFVMISPSILFAIIDLRCFFF